MPQREFVITELRRTSSGDFVDSPVRFVWDVEHRNSPHDAWEYTLRQRVTRDDYAGATEPARQVLGPAFDPFQLHGSWDDRFNYEGYADETRQAIQDLVARGNTCRVEFESIAFQAVITQCRVVYKRRFQIGYELTFDPDKDLNQSNPRQFEVEIVTDPFKQQLAVEQAIYDLVVAHLTKQLSVQPFTAGELYTSITSKLNDIQKLSDTARSIAESRTFLVRQTIAGMGDPNASFARLVQAHYSIAVAAAATLPEFAALSVAVDLAGNDQAMPVLNFEDWRRSVAHGLRQTFLAARQSYDQLSKLVRADIAAVYRPYAGESLYGISTTFYGSPWRWREIFERNRLHSFSLDGHELLIIPTGKT